VLSVLFSAQCGPIQPRSPPAAPTANTASRTSSQPYPPTQRSGSVFRKPVDTPRTAQSRPGLDRRISAQGLAVAGAHGFSPLHANFIVKTTGDAKPWAYRPVIPAGAAGRARQSTRIDFAPLRSSGSVTFAPLAAGREVMRSPALACGPTRIQAWPAFRASQLRTTRNRWLSRKAPFNSARRPPRNSRTSSMP